MRVENEDTLRCERCGKTHWEKPIVEKPIRVGYRSKLIALKQNTGDRRQQENICLDCLQSEISELKKKYERSKLHVD